MDPSPITTMDKPKIEIPLSLKNIDVLSGLAKWSKIVGIFHILLGILYCLSIFLLMIPTVILGAFFVVLGTRLTNASVHLKYCLQEPEEDTMVHALDNIRKYLLLNGIMFIVMFVSVYPLLYMISVSFMTAGEASNQYLIPKELRFEN